MIVICLDLSGPIAPIAPIADPRLGNHWQRRGLIDPHHTLKGQFQSRHHGRLMTENTTAIIQLLSHKPNTPPLNATRPLPPLVALLSWLDKRSPAGVCVVAAALIASIGILSYASCPQFSSSLLYLIPVLVVTRVAGIILGILAAFLAALIWFSADQWSAKDQQREAEFSPLRKLLRNLIFPCSKRQLRRLSLLLILTKPCSRPT